MVSIPLQKQRIAHIGLGDICEYLVVDALEKS